MYKEITISLLIIILILIGDFVTQRYTEKSVSDLSQNFEILKVNLERQDIQEALKNIEEIANKLDKYHKVLVYYIEHDELEKIETGFIASKSFVRTEDYNLAISELEKNIFILEHITDKYSFNLENIF